MLDVKDFVAKYRLNENVIDYDILREQKFMPVDGTFQKSIGLMGKLDEENSLFILAVSRKGDNENVVLLTTKKTYNIARVEVQNINTQLETNFGFINVEILYCEPSVIASMIQDGLNDDKSNEQLGDTDTQAIRKLKQIVLKALELNASDIHIYIKPDKAKYNYRVDGILTKDITLNRVEGREIISAGLSTLSDDFKGMVEDEQIVNANILLNVEPVNDKGEKQKPETVRLRTSKNPGFDGITVTMRVIPINRQKYADLYQLGLPKDIVDDLRTISHFGSGIFLMTGPTGSGKSTTLTAFYESIDPLKKLVLIEDPVEYVLRRNNVTQQQVLNKDGYKLEDQIESVLRQDPDMVGISEIRNERVAEIAIRQALTGHMMVSTMHTNDAISSVARLNDLKVPLVTLAKKNLLRGIMAQRLIPKLCPHCKIAQFKNVQFPPERFGNVHTRNPNGCAKCEHRGTLGRAIIAELIHIDAPARKYIQEERYEDWEKHLIEQGWRSMYHRVLPYIKKGDIDPYMATHFIDGLMTTEEDVHQYAEVEGL